MTHWLTISWWKFLLGKSAYPGERGAWLTAIFCRARNHPAGVIYYNPGGWEPDMTCKNCGDDLG